MGFETVDEGVRTVVLIGLAILVGYVLGAARPWVLRELAPVDDGQHVTELRGRRDLARVRLLRLRQQQQRADAQRPPLQFYDAARCRTGMEERRRAWAHRK